jgi:Bacterial conjugation TrbI-like protein
MRNSWLALFVCDTVQKTWGITDGSAGLRGVVIKSNNGDAVQMFVATFLAGLAQSVQGTTTNIFGQTVPSPNARGAGGVAGYIINPPAQGVEAVMDRYAQLIMDSIERDGFFIRVPAGKLFYVYVPEDINMAKATVGGSRRRALVENEYLSERDRTERVSEPRSRRDDPQRNPGVGIPIDPALTHRLDDASASMDARAAALDAQSQALSPDAKRKGKQ